MQKGDTLTSPQFTHGNQLDTFDYIVMNPPFSVKSWRNGLDLEYGRFEYGTPPEKNGDYAFLLHALTSLKSRGKAAIILPHGVLFRGNAEATIRTKLLKQGFIKGIIGLPANLFYGTGIPACIVVLDKEHAQARSGVFMIDASRGFIKDGNKNRLRDRDIHKIVDVFNKQAEIDRFSRMVPMAEIADPKNYYNLNIPRYIDSSEPEDLQDLNAHIHGGIPNHDLDLLSAYWDAFPSLRDQLFVANRPGYSDLKLEVAQVQQTILDSAEFKNFKGKARGHVVQWFESHRDALETIDAATVPNDLITTIGDDLLKRFKPVALLDEYAVYQQLMSYWHDTMHDDVSLILSDGWLDAAKPRLAITDKERKLAEEPDLTIGTGKNAKKYKMDLVPPALIVARYFADEQAKVDTLDADLESASAAATEHAEEHGVDEALLAEATNDKGAYTKQLLTAVVKDAKASHDAETLACANAALKLVNAEAAAKKATKDAQVALDLATLKKYGELTATDVKMLVLDNKWQKTIAHRVEGEADALTLDLVTRIQQLGERYASTLAELDSELAKLESQVMRHLSDMGVQS
ncbi:SAM-dependent methyltransferase [Dermacoccus nishinomiyaensis]|uniref:SAM-dependent methyltransferase n=1 Tax=Dermacoccus nishinomiyaensis TaxID=1274 RepID=UPI0021B1FF1F|nr:SAM-dependent methyltransferase [Dermacoccus nishinomiyaensis]